MVLVRRRRRRRTIVYHGPIIITGDLNIDLFVPSPEREAYNNILGSLNLKQHVSKPTIHDTKSTTSAVVF